MERKQYERTEIQVDSKYYVVKSVSKNQDGSSEIDILYDLEENLELSKLYRFELQWMDKVGNVVELLQINECNLR